MTWRLAFGQMLGPLALNWGPAAQTIIWGPRPFFKQSNKQTTNNHYLVWRAKSPLFAKQDISCPIQKEAKPAFLGQKLGFLVILGSKCLWKTNKQTNNTKQKKQTANKHYLVCGAKGPFFAKQDPFLYCSEKGQNSYFLVKNEVFGSFRGQNGFKTPIVPY